MNTDTNQSHCYDMRWLYSRGWTAAQAAAATGYHKSTIGRVLAGRNRSQVVLEKLQSLPFRKTLVIRRKSIV